MNKDYVNHPPVSEPERPLSWLDAAAPVMAVLLSALFWSVFSLKNAFARGYGPGLGVPVFVIAYFTAVFVMLRPRLRAGGAVTAGAALLLAISCALYAHPGFTILNCFVILLLSAMATFSLSGQARFCVLDIRAVPDAIRLSALALFTRIGRPFAAAKQAGRGKKGILLRLLVTALVTILLLAAVLALLASADMVFGSFFTGIRRWFETISLDVLIWRLVRILALALLISSGLYFLREPVGEKAEAKPHTEHPAIPFLAPALALDLVYLIFCAVQFRYLFGGAETAAMAGGWAEYARSGFFQLAAVALINLIVCVLSAHGGRLNTRGGRLLRIACAVMLSLTAVILASAAYRMHLYIAAFGMSVLRLMTLWGMLVIAFGILASGRKLLRPDASFWQLLFPFAVGTWCLLCLMNPAGRVADYNVNAYLDGRLATVDVEYLEELSPDAAPALKRLAASSEEYAAEAQSALRWLQRTVYWEGSTWSSLKASFRYLD